LPAIYTTSATTNSPIGTYSMVPGFLDPDGKLTNYTVFPTNSTLTITPAFLTVIADNKNRPYGATNPLLTASYSGWLNNDNPSVLSGSPELSTTADANSTVAGSPYPISISLGTLSATNYNLSFTNGILTVTPAAVLNSVISSVNPSPIGSNVIFTA